MGRIKLAAPVCLISAICFSDRAAAENALVLMTSQWGDLLARSDEYAFRYTQYYGQEMGEELYKFFIVFSRSIDPEKLVEIKLFTNEIEKRSSLAGHRRVNLDPGYLEAAKLVLATTKNFGHRIYLGRGIYGDVQLFWRHGQFQTNPWTYPDYQEPSALRFFTAVRESYLSKGEHVWPSPTSHLA